MSRLDAEGRAAVIAALNRLVEFVEEHLTEEIDITGLARELGTTEYHLRRMFSSLAGMPLSEYVRRRRMTVAASEVPGPSMVAVLERAADFSTATTELWLPVERA
jgi:AraC-like DNA-binding protein